MIRQLLDDGKAVTACTKKGLDLLKNNEKGDASVAIGTVRRCAGGTDLGCRGEEDGMDGDNEWTTLAKAVEELKRAQQSDKESAEPMQVLACLRNEQGKRTGFEIFERKHRPSGGSDAVGPRDEREIFTNERDRRRSEDYASSSEDDMEKEEEKDDDDDEEYCAGFQDHEVSFGFD